MTLLRFALVSLLVLAQLPLPAAAQTPPPEPARWQLEVVQGSRAAGEVRGEGATATLALRTRTGLRTGQAYLDWLLTRLGWNTGYSLSAQVRAREGALSGPEAVTLCDLLGCNPTQGGVVLAGSDQLWRLTALPETTGGSVEFDLAPDRASLRLDAALLLVTLVLDVLPGKGCAVPNDQDAAKIALAVARALTSEAGLLADALGRGDLDAFADAALLLVGRVLEVTTAMLPGLGQGIAVRCTRDLVLSAAASAAKVNALLAIVAVEFTLRVGKLALLVGQYTKALTSREPPTLLRARYAPALAAGTPMTVTAPRTEPTQTPQRTSAATPVASPALVRPTPRATPQPLATPPRIAPTPAFATVWAWGLNGGGQLGDDSRTDRLTPVRVSGLGGVSAIAAGDYHSLALKGDGTVWAWGWGWGNSGQLGDGSATDRSTPVRVSGLSGVSAVAAGAYHSLALK